MSKPKIPIYESESDNEDVKKESKRKLTEDEMYNITDFLEIDPEKDFETSIAVLEEVRKGLFKQLSDVQIYPSKIPQLKTIIKNDFELSKIDAGTAVGNDAALSIGEPTTQQSSDNMTRVVLRQGQKTFNITIGDFIDEAIDNAWMTLEGDHEDSTIVLNNAFENTEIMTISQDEKVSWNKITELSRHNANGDLVKITTDSGRTTTCTLSHSFLTRNRNGVIPILGKDLKVGDRVPVTLSTPIVENPITNIELWEDKIIELTKEFGEFLGIYIAEGSTCKSSNTVSVSTTQDYYINITRNVLKNITNKTIKTVEKNGTITGRGNKLYPGKDHSISNVKLSKWIKSHIGSYAWNKELPGFIYGCDKKFIASVIRGMFDGDGNVHGNRKSIKYHSTSVNLIEQVALLLSFFGIFCSYQIEREECIEYINIDTNEVSYELKNEWKNNNNIKTRNVKSLWVLLIYGSKYGKIYYDEIGTNNTKKKIEMEIYVHDNSPERNFIDQIPYCAEFINKVGRGLKLPGASRNYGRWVTKEANGLCIGKNTLIKYVELFKEKNEEKQAGFDVEIAILQQAIDADVVWDKIVKLEIVKTDEFVYDFSVDKNETFATQSGIFIHNTLNSLDYKEHIVVKNNKNNSIISPQIGKFVDDMMEEYKDKIKIYDGVTDYVDISHLNMEVPCVDENGKMSYKLLEAVTRHPPPGGEKLIKVTTQTGRSVIATKAKSFLQRINNKIVGVEGRNLKVGDRLPISVKFPRPPENERLQSINLSRYLSKEKFVFGTDLWRAREIRDEYQQTKKYKNNRTKEEMDVYNESGRNSRWWTENYGIEFVVPYKRGDTAMDALEGKNKQYIKNKIQADEIVFLDEYERKESDYQLTDDELKEFEDESDEDVKNEWIQKRIKNKMKEKEEIIRPGFVYTTKRTIGVINEIPEELELDEDFGFVVGAYIAEGHCDYRGEQTKSSQCIISNNDKTFRNRIKRWCIKHNLRYHVQTQHDKHFEGATSTDLRIHSTLMCEWFKNMCGNYSDKKYIPDFTLLANDKFIKGMIDGYFSGDGSVDKTGCVTCSSASEKLIDELMMVLNMYDIFSYKSFTQIKKNNIGSKNILPGYILSIRAGNAVRFYENFTIMIDYKQDRLNLNKNKKSKSYYYHNDFIPITTNNLYPGVIKRDILQKFLDKKIDEKELENNFYEDENRVEEKDENNEYIDDLTIINNAVSLEVMFDKIISIEEIESSTPLVYDLTVKETRNFAVRNGFQLADTFHLSGISAANVTLGVPRTNEILNASKNQKTNNLYFSLLPSVTNLKNLQSMRDKCRSTFEERYVDQVTTKHEVLFQKYNNLSSDDNVWYSMFSLIYNSNYKECDWCIRLYLNKLIMYQYNLSTEKIAKTIENEFKDCRCVFSPDFHAIIDIYIDTTNIDTPSVILAAKKKSRKKDQKETKKSVITDENKDIYFVSRVALDYILDTKLSGIEGIEKVYYQLNSKTKEWKLETSGTNMREVMNNKDVDFKTVISNNMWEIFSILGIEATRKFLIEELTSVISFGGTYIDPVHQTLLADSMTSTGTITSVNRYGISKSVVGILTPAAFEQSHKNMLDAPAKGVTDDLTTVSAGIIVGKHVRIGTGYCDLFTDRKKLQGMTIPKNIHRTLPVISEEVKNVTEPGLSSVFRSGGVGKVIERNNEKEKIVYVDF